MVICRRDLLRKVSGMLPNINVKQYDYFQLYEIYLGLISNLDVTKYIDIHFSSTQMQQIRYGLLSGIDVSKYAKVELEDYEMFDIRQSLEREAKHEQGDSDN